MGVRPFFGVVTLAGTAQPIFGTGVTAAFTPPPDPFSDPARGGNSPGTNQTQVSVPVTSTLGFLTGDNVAIGAAALFKPGLATAGLDYGTVKKIVDATHLIVQGLTKAHASGEWCVLSEEAGNVHLTPVAITAIAYIGNASTVAAADPSVIDILPVTSGSPSSVVDFESIGGSQPFTLTEFWILGTGTFIPRFTEV